LVVEDTQVLVSGDQPDQIQCLVPLPHLAADGVEEDLLGIQQILDLVEQVDLVVAADTIQEAIIRLILVVLLQIVIKDLLEEQDSSLDQNMVEVAVAVPVVLVEMPPVVVLIM
jgi:hypothetical protein